MTGSMEVEGPGPTGRIDEYAKRNVRRRLSASRQDGQHEERPAHSTDSAPEGQARVIGRAPVLTSHKCGPGVSRACARLKMRIRSGVPPPDRGVEREGGAQRHRRDWARSLAVRTGERPT